MNSGGDTGDRYPGNLCGPEHLGPRFLPGGTTARITGPECPPGRNEAQTSGAEFFPGWDQCLCPSFSLRESDGWPSIGARVMTGMMESDGCQQRGIYVETRIEYIYSCSTAAVIAVTMHNLSGNSSHRRSPPPRYHRLAIRQNTNLSVLTLDLFFVPTHAMKVVCGLPSPQV